MVQLPFAVSGDAVVVLCAPKLNAASRTPPEQSILASKTRAPRAARLCFLFIPLFKLE